MQTKSPSLRSSVALGALVASLAVPVASQRGSFSGGVAGTSGSQLPVAGIVLPSGRENQEAAGLAFWALSPFDARRQVVIAERLIAGFRGKEIVSVTVRRNYSRDDYESGSVDLEVSMSHGATNSWNVSEAFAANRGGDHTKVFEGPVFLPAAPAPLQSPPTWDYPNVVTITFDRPFLYTGGPLCLETVTKNTGQNAAWWPIDADVNGAEGEVIAFGTSCMRGTGAAPAGAEPGSFTIGSTGVFFLRGSATVSSAMCLIGADNAAIGGLPLPLDLTAVGMSGCMLYSNSSLLLSATLAPLGNGPIGHASATLEIPVDAGLEGVVLYSQWMLADPGANAWGLTFSNGVQTTIGASRVRNIGWLETTDLNSSVGRLLPGRVPVLRLDSQ